MIVIRFTIIYFIIYSTSKNCFYVGFISNNIWQHNLDCSFLFPWIQKLKYLIIGINRMFLNIANKILFFNMLTSYFVTTYIFNKVLLSCWTNFGAFCIYLKGQFTIYLVLFVIVNFCLLYMHFTALIYCGQHITFFGINNEAFITTRRAVK
jgi:hypothetical protein